MHLKRHTASMPTFSAFSIENDTEPCCANPPLLSPAAHPQRQPKTDPVIERKRGDIASQRMTSLELYLVESLAVDAEGFEIGAGGLAMCANSGRNRERCTENGESFTEEVTRCLCNLTHFSLHL
jgi:hypothetical protein